MSTSMKHTQSQLPDAPRLTGLNALETKEFSCRGGKPVPQQKAHWHNEIEINIISHGSMTYLWHGNRRHIRAPAIALFWGGMPHQVIDVGNDSECFWIYIPLPWFLQWNLPGEFTQEVLGGQLTEQQISGDSGPLLELASRWRHDLREEDTELNAIVLLEIHAQIRRLARNFQSSASGGHARHLHGPIDRLEAMVKFMAANFQERLVIADIAAAADLHPNYACALFKQACGITLHNYLTQLRISHAQRLLVTTDRTVIDIASEAGFGSASRFYEAFKASCNQSPDEFRKAHSY